MNKTDYFPRTEVGLWANVVKCFRLINISQGEYVFKAGETAEAIYFILEGNVLLLGPEEKTAIAQLGKYDVFGELFTVEETIKIRRVFAKDLAQTH